MHRLFYILVLFSTFSLSISGEGAQSAACDVFFSPKDQLADKLIQLIDKEQKSIEVAIYCITHRGIAEALIQAKRRGVSVDVLVDPFSVKKRFPTGRLASCGVGLFVWDPGIPKTSEGERKTFKKAPMMHDKFCVFGHQTVWTGSFNFTYEASLSNRENAVVIKDAEIAKRYLDQFRTMKSKGARPYEEYLTAHPFPVKKSRKVK